METQPVVVTETTTATPVTTEKQGVKGFLSKMARPFKYQTKRHGLISEFSHDSAIAEDINTLSNFSKEYNNLSRTVDALLDTEKTYSVSLLRNGHKFVENTHQFHTSRVANHLKGFSELQLQLAQLHSNFVSSNLEEMSWFFKNFNKSNIKNSKLLKHEVNVAAMNRDDNVRAYTSKADKESKNYFNEKHDDMGLRLAEERKIMSQQQYELAGQKLEESMMELYEFEAREIVPQLQSLIEAQKQYYLNALNVLNTASNTLNTLPIEPVTLPLQRKGSLMTHTLPVLPPAQVGSNTSGFTATNAPLGTSSNIAIPPAVGTSSGLPSPGNVAVEPPIISSTSSTVPTYSSSTTIVPPSTVYPSAALEAKDRDLRINELQQQLGGTGVSPAKFVHNA